MAAPINTPLTGDIWHLCIDDLLAPLPEKARLGGSGPFVINLSASTAPIGPPAEKNIAGCQTAYVYQVQRTEDRRLRYRLRLGPFATEDEADAILDKVRDHYPSALTATADAEDLRAIATMQARAGTPSLTAPAPIAAAPSAKVPPPPPTATPAPVAAAPPTKVPPPTATAPLIAAAPSMPHFAANPATPAEATTLSLPVLTVEHVVRKHAPTPLPAKPMPVKPPPVKATPVKVTPVEAMPVKAMPVKPTPVKALPSATPPAQPAALKTSISAAPQLPAATAAAVVPAQIATGSRQEFAPPAAAARHVEQLSMEMLGLETTQTIRALTAVELEDDVSLRWFVIQLSLSEEAFDSDTVPNLDIFNVYRLYCVAGIDQGRILHALRLGFFSEEVAAAAVASYLAEFYDKPTVKRVSAAERNRFADQRFEPRKDVGATGRHAVIEITNERYIREKRTTPVSAAQPPVSQRSR
jgi:hypothetical protein